MVHAFSDANGAETFAFMPSAVLGQVKELSKVDYIHRYFVDGPLVEADIHARKDWADTFVKGLEVLGMKYEERTEIGRAHV